VRPSARRCQTVWGVARPRIDEPADAWVVNARDHEHGHPRCAATDGVDDLPACSGRRRTAAIQAAISLADPWVNVVVTLAGVATVAQVSALS